MPSRRGAPEKGAPFYVRANAGICVLNLIVRQLGERRVYNGERKTPKIFPRCDKTRGWSMYRAKGL